MKFLVGIPCLYGAGHTQEAFESVVHHPDTELLIIDNGAEMPVKEVISYYAALPNVYILRNSVNLYVNPAWNKILQRFLESDWDYLMIMNSDLILHAKWKEVLDYTLTHNPKIIPVPIITPDKGILNHHVEIYPAMVEIFEGPAGVLIILNKQQAKLVYPIPETLKVRFGDNWIYEGLRKAGYPTFVLDNLLTYHSGSQNVSRVPGISEIIEQDKKAWEALQSE